MEFYEELYRKEENLNQETQFGKNKDKNVPKIIEEEVELIWEIKKEKAPGPEKIGNKILKSLEHTLIPIFTELLNKILEIEKSSEQWEMVQIKCLHKKGDRANMSNYRIAAQQHKFEYNKFFMKVAKNRIIKFMKLQIKCNVWNRQASRRFFNHR